MRKTKKRNTKRNNKRRIKKNNKRRTKRNNKRRLKRNNKRRTKRNNKRRSYKGGGVLSKLRNLRRKGDNYKVAGYDFSFKPEEYFHTHNKHGAEKGGKKKGLKVLYQKFKNKKHTIANFNIYYIYNNSFDVDKFFSEETSKKIKKLKNNLINEQNHIETLLDLTGVEKKEEEEWFDKFYEHDIDYYIRENFDIYYDGPFSLMRIYNIIFNYIMKQNNCFEGDVSVVMNEIKAMKISTQLEIITDCNDTKNVKPTSDEDVKLTSDITYDYNKIIKEEYKDDEELKNQRQFIQDFFIKKGEVMLIKEKDNYRLLNIMKYIYNYERLILLKYMEKCIEEGKENMNIRLAAILGELKRN